MAAERARSRSLLRGRHEELTGDAWSADELARCCNAEAATAAGQELADLAASPLHENARCGAAWRALCLRRDIRALLRAQPAHGVDGLPAVLASHGAFTAAMRACLRRLEQRAAQRAQGLPLNALYGAWEGGVPAGEVRHEAAREATLPCRICAFNVQGACGRVGALEIHEEQVFQLAATLQQEGVVLAVLSEPRLGPGMV